MSLSKAYFKLPLFFQVPVIAKWIDDFLEYFSSVFSHVMSHTVLGRLSF